MKATIKKEVEVELKSLQVRAGVRYWEDASVNGVEDTEGVLIPLRKGDNWCPQIDIETGKIYSWPQGTTADIHYKICDDGDYTIFDVENEVVLNIDGYVPGCLAIDASGYGDYIIMKVDENGMIQNWKFNLEDFIEDND